MTRLFLAAVARARRPAGRPRRSRPLDPQNTVYLDTKDGRVTIRLRPDLAPKHVAQIKALTKRGFYNGIVFHRVIAGFMAQTGDPTGTGTGGSDLPNLPAEFTSEPFKRGSVGMARSQDPNSANSQFFICFGDAGRSPASTRSSARSCPAWRSSTRSRRATPADNGKVTDPDKIVKMQLAGGSPNRPPTTVPSQEPGGTSHGRSREHPRPRNHQGHGRDRAAPRPRARATSSASRTLAREGFYDGIVVPPRHRGLHGPDRRPDRHRHRRLEASRT